MFGRLPPMQYATGWVLSCIGRAYFEMGDYHQAALAFQYARKADPSRLEVLLRMLPPAAQSLNVVTIAASKAESQICRVCHPVNVTLLCQSRPWLGHGVKEDIRGGLSSLVCTHCERGAGQHGAVAPEGGESAAIHSSSTSL